MLRNLWWRDTCHVASLSLCDLSQETTLISCLRSQTLSHYLIIFSQWGSHSVACRDLRQTSTTINQLVLWQHFWKIVPENTHDIVSRARLIIQGTPLRFFTQLKAREIYMRLVFRRYAYGIVSSARWIISSQVTPSRSEPLVLIQHLCIVHLISLTCPRILW